MENIEETEIAIDTTFQCYNDCILIIQDRDTVSLDIDEAKKLYELIGQALYITKQ